MTLLTRRALSVLTVFLLAAFALIGVRSLPAYASSKCGIAHPSNCGYPDGTNSGVPSSIHLTNVPGTETSGTGWSWVGYPEDCIEVTTAGVTVSDLYVADGCIQVEADNVTLNDDRVLQEGNSWGVGIEADNATVENTTIYGGGDTKGLSPDDNRLEVGVKDVYGDATGTQVLNDSFYDMALGVQIAAGTISGNYLRDFDYACIGSDAGTVNCGTPAQCTPDTCDHVDGIYAAGGTSEGLVISDNSVFNEIGQTDAIALFEAPGDPQENVTVENNFLTGGAYTVYGGCGDHGGSTTPENMVFTGNRFSNAFYPDSGTAGSSAYVCTSSTYNEVWSGNFWDSTGATVVADS